MTRLNMPLVEYFRQRLTEEIGAEDIKVSAISDTDGIIQTI
jgi:hypothetical protein